MVEIVKVGKKMDDYSIIFIPYQDTDNFYEDGILTREYAILSLLHSFFNGAVFNIKKPRTVLDKRKYIVDDSYYPVGSMEYKVKSICDNSNTVQFIPIFEINQVLKRRNWWIEGYNKTINLIPWDKIGKAVVYSDNPFAVKLIYECKKRGMVVYFDIMDNFAIHPSLSHVEQNGALEAYKEIVSFADIVSANSAQTCNYMKHLTSIEPILVKNGVFQPESEMKFIKPPFCKELAEKKKYFRKCVGYIGKLGLRIDANLVEKLADRCTDVLFVFVGPFLKGQTSTKLKRLINCKNNIIHFDSIPSAYVYPTIEEFDICMLPHAVGKAENGGDPLKLYQYMTTSKPIISTRIIGVDEFSEVIKISNDIDEWVSFIEGISNETKRNINSFIWSSRFIPIKELLIKYTDDL